MRWVRVIFASIAVAGLAIALAAARRIVTRSIQPPFRPVVENLDDPGDDPVLEIQCCSQIEEITFLRISGTAKNMTDEPLKNVIAHATYLDRDGRPVASAQSLLEVPMLMPHSSSSFAITTPVNPAIARISVDFRIPDGPQLPARFLPRSGDHQVGEDRASNRGSRGTSTPAEVPEPSADRNSRNFTLRQER